MRDWKEYTINEIAEVTSSKRIFLSDYVSEGIPFYRSKEVIEKSNGNDISLELFIRKEQFENIKGKFGAPEENDILLTSVGTIGVPYKVRKDELFYFKDGNLTWIRKFKGEADPSFLLHWLKSELGQQKILQNTIGSSQPALTIAAIKKIKLQLPPLPTQQRIASILSAYDDLIEVNNRRIKLLEETARELYKEWFVRMRFPGYKDAKFVKGVPEGWEVKRIAEVFEILGGGTPSTAKPEYWDGNVNWFTPTDITGASGIFLSESSNKISEQGLKESSAKLFPPYSIMMTSRATIGAVGINTMPGCTNQGFITCLPNKNIPYTFLYFWILMNKEIFEMLGTGSTFLEITKGTFKKIKMLLPKSEVLNQYHKVAEPMFQQIEILQQQNTQLRQIRDRLLPRLISGKLEVK
jgi:type I restriction enzyme S subunit